MMDINKVYVPPLKIQGIKTKLVPLIKSKIDLGSFSTWIEPFMGSAVVGLNVAPRKAIFADINPHIITFYNQLKCKAITARIIKGYLSEQNILLSEKGAEHYYYIRDRFNKEHNPLDFLFLNRSCFNGMIRFNRSGKFNVPYGHKPERFAKAYITKIYNQVLHFEQMLQMNDWQFICQPFEKTIALANEESFIYCDPPYIGRHVDYYDNWDEDNETKLKQLLISSNSKFMVSTWDYNRHRHNPYISTVWNGLQKISHEHFYFVGANEENRNFMMEALLVNYDAVNASCVPTSLYEEQISMFAAV